jgi:hypothetical protein
MPDVESAVTVAVERDARAWRALADSGPFRTVRWLVVVGFFAAFWAVEGTPNSASGWLPVVIVAVLGFLPDASKISVGGVSFVAKQAADRAEAASQVAVQHAERAVQANEQAQQVSVQINLGEELGKLAVGAREALTAAEAQTVEAERPAWDFAVSLAEPSRMEREARSRLGWKPVRVPDKVGEQLARMGAADRAEVLRTLESLSWGAVGEPFWFPGDDTSQPASYRTLVPGGSGSAPAVVYAALANRDEFVIAALFGRDLYDKYARLGEDPVVRGVAASVAAAVTLYLSLK